MSEDISTIGSKGVIAHIDSKTFADIIINFLGSKQRLKYEVYDKDFIIRRNDLEQFYYLINDKLKKERNNAMDYFSVSIQYNDKTKREINGIESLNSFLETRDVKPISVTLSWNIVLDFPTSDTIENQKIEVTFVINDKNTRYGIFNRYIILNIEHTNQAWGIEILNLMKNHVDSLTVKHSSTFNHANSVKSWFDTGYFALLFILLLFGTPSMLFFIEGKMESSINQQQSVSISNVLKIPKSEHYFQEKILAFQLINRGYYSDFNESFQSLEAKQILENYYKDNQTIIENSEYSKNILMNILYSILTILLFIFIYSQQTIKFLETKSFILTTSRADKEYELFNNNKSKFQYYSLSLIAFSIACSVIANAIYQYM